MNTYEFTLKQNGSMRNLVLMKLNKICVKVYYLYK